MKIYGLHRLAMWMEARGWLYVLEERRKEDTEEDESGDPPARDTQQTPIIPSGVRHVVKVTAHKTYVNSSW